ncbi:hypothetical protein PVAP13_8KG157600 [Panicum virgatum]|uniref:Uncharacterized protein n=1 Tax=Panicum virgatum TaxID=38727 RepID=A0A8T0PH01_PANVG|nr:hypothetical protein PVAP13_8KG157600 [Panicum virgatum]
MNLGYRIGRSTIIQECHSTSTFSCTISECHDLFVVVVNSARMMEGHRAGHRKHSKCQLITEKAMVDHEWMHNTWNTCGFFSTSLVRFCSWGGTEVISFKMIRAFYLRNSLSVIKWLGCLCLG